MNASKKIQSKILDTIDVVIPTFNETINLVRAVDSVKRQTVSINKIYVIDDGSNQEVQSFLSQKYDSDDIVELVLKSHSGLPGVSRKLGINLSSAEWIAFLDADDYWVENKLEIQLSIASSTRASFVCSNALMVGGQVESPYFKGQLFLTSIKFGNLVRSNTVVNSSVLVRRALLRRVGYYPDSSKLRGVEDYATWLRISVLTRLRGTPDCLVFYQVSPNSLSRVEKTITRNNALIDFEHWLLRQLVKNPWLSIRLIQLLLHKARVIFDLRIEAFRKTGNKNSQARVEDS